MLIGLLVFLAVVAGAAAVGGGLYVAAKRRQLAGESLPALTGGEPPLLERTLHDLRTGDVIQHGSRDYLVEGLVSYDEDGHRWSAGRLVDGDVVLWLVAGMERLGARSSLRLLSEDREVAVSGFPPDNLVVGDVRFRLDTRGTASAKFSGDVGPLPGKRGDPKYDTVERCRWWRYEGPGDETLIVEQWGGEYRVLRGQRVSDIVLEMIPGS
jgi:hypothetical protein